MKKEKFFPPKKSSAINYLLKANPEHPLAKEYLARYNEYQNNITQAVNEKKEKPQQLPELHPIYAESFYELFKKTFHILHGKAFDESINNGEPRQFARTLMLYFLGYKKSFVKSPLLNSQITDPSMRKGLMIIGGKGVGKTSILKTFHWIFYNAMTNGIKVKDVNGTEQYLWRYKIHFSFYAANNIVNDYESITNSDEKDYFWKKHNGGCNYYDDIMSERVGSNYGKIDVFRDIFENRYNNTNAKTIISLNYSGSLEDTLNAFAERYGERVFDRIFEMFNVLEMKGGSLRK